MMSRFSKMHGLGNDFVVIDARQAPVAMTQARARAIADRHAGIGCDQLIVIGDAETGDQADVSTRLAAGASSAPRFAAPTMASRSRRPWMV